MEWYRECSVTDHQADLGEIGLSMKKDSKIVVGNFVDIERPTFMDRYREIVKRARARLEEDRG